MTKMTRTTRALTAAALMLALAAPAWSADKDDRPNHSDRSPDRAKTHPDRAAERAAPRAESAPRRPRPTVRVETRHFARVGEHVRRLPEGHTRILVGGVNFYYFGGSFYRWLGPDYVIVRAPIGARVRVLPAGYVSFLLGTRHFFFVNSTYYLWEPGLHEYVVVEEPEGAEAAVAATQQSTSEADSESGEIFAYPNQGQSDEQARRDRYECHLWAADQSGYDPTYSDRDDTKRGDYRRAMSACLVGRGYTVR